MKITIDTEKKKIIVPDTFFNQIDKINEAIKLGGGTPIGYTDYVKKEFEECISTPMIRKSDKQWQSPKAQKLVPKKSKKWFNYMRNWGLIKQQPKK